MNGVRMGILTQRANRSTLTYEEQWRAHEAALPLSLSMPLVSGEHPSRVVEPFLWNLLPDNAEILRSWARRFHVSVNAFALLEHVGEDVAGAAQFVRPERVEILIQNGGRREVQWIDEVGIARRLRELRVDRSAWSKEGDLGHFSLAGAQPKLALLHQRDRWGIPGGRLPTTHILKPPVQDFTGHVENEHFCLQLAAAAGLPVTASRVQYFEDQPAIVVERFDRIRQGGVLVRVPMEDMCQALAIHPDRKYQRDGGPGPVDIFNLLAGQSAAGEEDRATFFDALAYNFLIGGADAHAKNYSLLIGAGGRVRLAPLYDIASALPYYDPKRLKLAMKIHRHYELKDVRARDWDALGVAAGLGPDQHVRVLEQARALPDHISDTARSLKARGLTHAIIGVLAEALQQHVKSVTQRLRPYRR